MTDAKSETKTEAKVNKKELSQTEVVEKVVAKMLAFLSPFEGALNMYKHMIDVPVEVKIEYIRTNIAPHKENLESGINTLAYFMGAPADFDKKKLKRYLSCLIEVCEKK